MSDLAAIPKPNTTFAELMLQKVEQLPTWTIRARAAKELWVGHALDAYIY